MNTIKGFKMTNGKVDKETMDKLGIKLPFEATNLKTDGGLTVENGRVKSK
jgi:hypothetical protein